MGLATYDPTKPSRVTPEDHLVVAEPKKHEIYDHRNTPLWSLEASMQGAPWKLIAYFQQRLGANDAPKGLDLNLKASSQSYNRIDKLELLVQTALSPSFDTKQATMEVTGEAILYSFIVPNREDYFLAESNIGRMGLFRINDVRRGTHEKNSIHTVQYSIVDEITENDPRFGNLYEKSSTVAVFSKQRLIENLNPLLLSETYGQVQSLQTRYKSLVEFYFRSFFDKGFNLMYVPGQDARYYDPFMMEFLLSIVGTADAPEIGRMGRVSMNNGRMADAYTFWTAMAERNWAVLDHVNPRMGRKSPQSFYVGFTARTAYYGNADYLLVPYIYDDSTRTGNLVQEAATGSKCACDDTTDSVPFLFKQTTTSRASRIVLADAVYKVDVGVIPIYTPIHTLTTFVFPEAFYDGRSETLMEILTRDYLKGAPVDIKQLIFMLEFYPKMERLEQFFFGPILMALIKQADRGAYA